MNEGTSVFRYRQLAQQLREAIRRGEYPPSSMLPSEVDLATRHGITRPTVRRALAVLKTEGLIEVHVGRGAVVTAIPPIRLPVNRYRSGAARPGVGPWEATVPGGRGELFSMGRQVADERVAALLEIEPGSTVIYRRRHMHAAPDDAVVQVQESRFPLAVVDGTLIAGEARIPQGTYAALREIGHPPATVTEDVTARFPTADEEEIMRVSNGMPVLCVVRVTRDTAGLAVEVVDVVSNADRVVLRYEDLPLDW